MKILLVFELISDIHILNKTTKMELIKFIDHLIELLSTSFNQDFHLD